MQSDHPCPDCATPMDTAAGDHERVLVCPACSGQMHGLSPFERLLADGVGASVWVAAEDGRPAQQCPYCRLAMRRPDRLAGAPDGMAVCRLCEQVWVPVRAASWMAEHRGTAATAATATPPMPTRCENCGAPAEPDELGRCRYCQAQISSPAPVLL